MTTIEEHRTHFRKGNITYEVEVTSQLADDGATHQVAVRLGGADPDGRPVADGRLDVDRAELETVAGVLADELMAAAGLPVRSRRSWREPPANQGRPWSEELDAELEKRWLAGESLVAIADDFQRTRNAILRRLPLVGCDPYRPGEYLRPPPSQRSA